MFGRNHDDHNNHVRKTYWFTDSTSNPLLVFAKDASVCAVSNQIKPVFWSAKFDPPRYDFWMLIRVMWVTWALTSSQHRLMVPIVILVSICCLFWCWWHDGDDVMMMMVVVDVVMVIMRWCDGIMCCNAVMSFLWCCMTLCDMMWCALWCG